MIMGLTGLAIAWRKAEDLLDLPLHASPWLLYLATLLFMGLAGLYAVKTVRHRQAALAEWTHPVKMHFVPTFSIALILLSIGWYPLSAPYSKLLWLAGASLHLLLTIYIVTRWMHQSRFEIVHMNPAWFIPAVGNIMVPIVGVEHAPLQISWFFFSIGITFWPLLLTIIFYRVLFHGSLPDRLLPTLFILIAPPAVGFLAYVKLIGSVDSVAAVLYHTGLFFTLLLFAQLSWFARLRFSISWWAYSFPLAAITLASLGMFEQTEQGVFLRIAGILLAVTTVLIGGLFLRTLVAVARREVCQAD